MDDGSVWEVVRFWIFFFNISGSNGNAREKKEIKVDAKVFVSSKENDVTVIFKLMNMGTITGRRGFDGERRKSQKSVLDVLSLKCLLDIQVKLLSRQFYVCN